MINYKSKVQLLDYRNNDEFSEIIGMQLDLHLSLTLNYISIELNKLKKFLIWIHFGVLI